MKIGIAISTCATLSAVLLVAAAAEAVSPAAKCQSKKLTITATYSSCRLKAQAKAVKVGSTPALLAAAFAKCDATFAKKWAAAEKRGGEACPTFGDAGPLQARAFDFAHFAALSLDAARFIDNGDGTVTDTRTGLQWEKKVAADSEANYGDPHDVDNTYTWSATGTAPDGTAFTQFLGALNTCVSPFGNDGFAGHCDWRLPTLEELKSIMDIDVPGCGTTGIPCVDPIFIPTALPPLGDIGPPFYWSSISGGTNALSWGFDFTSCTCPKSTPNWVRAVRGGPGPLVSP
jgi:hypothetical protein